MKMAKIRFLEKGEQPSLPKGASLLPERLQKKVLETCRPYHLRVEKEILTGILQTVPENSMTPIWRRRGAALLERLKKDGAEIIIPPVEGELPRGILPFADGRRLTHLFAFAGAEEALKRLGKRPEECRYLLAGGDIDAWRMALLSAGNALNHLAIFTADPDGTKELKEELLEERGLVPEVFSSPKNPAFRQADVVFGCGMEQHAYEHMLGKGAVWIDLAGNRPILRRLREQRPDLSVADGFFFRRGKRQTEGRAAEAEAFLNCPVFRENQRFPLSGSVGGESLRVLREEGYAVSGFSFMGKRVKIVRKP